MDVSADVLSLPATTYAWVMGVAVVGGLVGYMNKTNKYTVVDMVKSTLTSALTGFLAFCACYESGASMGWTLFAVGVAGLMGKRAWEDMENIIRVRVGLPTKGTGYSSGGYQGSNDYNYPRQGGGGYQDPRGYSNPDEYTREEERPPPGLPPPPPPPNNFPDTDREAPR
jgi:uncharacterized membrane protein (UPF0136 family)